MTSSSLQDIRYAFRALRRNPAFAMVVILTLAFGIGMNTAVFSVVNAVLLHPLPYPDPGRLTWLAEHDQFFRQDTWGSRADYLIWREQARSFERLTAYGNQDLAVFFAGESTQERIASITGDFWSIAGAQPALGRLFRPGDQNAIVLAHSLFERRFASDPRAIGKTLTVNGAPFTIAGVLPRNFRFLFPQQLSAGDGRKDIDAYIPIPGAFESPGTVVTQERGPAPPWVCVVGKLRPGVSLDRARSEMETIHARIGREFPSPFRQRLLRVVPLQDKLVGGGRRALMVLMAAVGFVLLIACVNIAGLFLARASTRQREIAIRSALGAGRMRVLRQLLAESVVLAMIGGAAGLLFARWSLDIILRLAPRALPRLEETTIDGWALVFTFAVSFATGILFGLGPSLSLGGTRLQQALKDDARTSSGSAGRLRARGFLVAVELALAIVLLAGAGLMLKSFWRMNANAPGFEPDKILVMRIPLSGQQYAAWAPKAAYIDQLLRRLEAAPGVRAAGIDCATFHTAVEVEGVPRADKPPLSAVRMVSPGYLRAMGAPLVQGRWPVVANALSAVVVNESFLRAMAVDGDPIGRRIGGSFLSGTIVGVVADLKYRQLDAEPSPEVYYPFQRSPVTRALNVVVRTGGDAVALAPFVRRLTAEIDRTQPVYDLRTLEQALSDSIAPRRFNMFLLAAFAATALLLALIGIYGVVNYSVAQRTHEIGIRMALGAARGEVVRMVIRQGMEIALAGIGAGLVAAAGLTRLMAGLLYGVEPNDPIILAAVALTLALAAVLACSAPALKASWVDPITALRHE